MVSHMEATSLERFLVHILTPVYRLIEDDTIRDSQMGKSFISPSFHLILFKISILTFLESHFQRN